MDNESAAIANDDVAVLAPRQLPLKTCQVIGQSSTMTNPMTMSDLHASSRPTGRYLCLGWRVSTGTRGVFRSGAADHSRQQNGGIAMVNKIGLPSAPQSCSLPDAVNRLAASTDGRSTRRRRGGCVPRAGHASPPRVRARPDLVSCQHRPLPSPRRPPVPPGNRIMATRINATM